MKINILLCDIFEDIMPFEDISYVSMIQTAFNAVRPNITYEIFEAFARDLPVSIEENATYLIPGSRFEAWSDSPWLNELRTFIQELHREQAKIIGFGFGHQVIAEALGGRVEKTITGNGLGVRTSTFSDDSVATLFRKKTLQLFYFHQEQVVIPPPESKIFVSSPFCPIDGLTVNKHIITVQGHPEYTEQYIQFLLRKKMTPEISRIKALKTLQQDTNEKELITYILHFLQV